MLGTKPPVSILGFKINFKNKFYDLFKDIFIQDFKHSWGADIINLHNASLDLINKWIYKYF